jgi:hypothetical protein
MTNHSPKGLSGDINGTLRLNASADGSFSSPTITLFELPLPGGIVIPGYVADSEY